MFLADHLLIPENHHLTRISPQSPMTMKKPKPMTRKAMQSIADVYPGRKIIVLMPGDKVPDELKPKKRRKQSS
jgi:hypothetical protein